MYNLLLGSEYVVSIVLLLMALTLFKNNVSKPVQYIRFALFTMFLLNVGYLLEIQCTTIEGVVTATKLEYCGSVFTNTFMLFVMMEYLKLNLSRIIKSVLVAVDVVFLLFVITNEYHGLFFNDITYSETGLFPHAEFSNGVVRNIFAYYTMILGIIMLILITYFFIQGLRGGRKIPLVLILAMYMPVGTVIFHMTGLMGIVDLSPIVIGIAGISMYIFLSRAMIFEVVHVAEHMVMDTMQDAFIVMDTQMRLLDMNNSAGKLFPELKDESSDSQFVYDKSDILRQIINERPNDIVPIGDRYYFIRLSEIKRNNTLEGYYLHLSDRTDYKKYTDELIERSIEAEEESAAKSSMLASTSHDIRTPINAIIGMNELIIRNSSDKTILEYAFEVRNSSSYLLSLVNDILDISKIEAVKMNIIDVEYNMADMLNEVMSMAGFMVKEKKLAFSYNIDKNLPTLLYGDEVRIKQIINNLLSNSVKYTEKGYVILKVSLLEINDEKSNKEALIHFEVKDTGIGIKEEDMQRILEPFQRLDEVRNRNKQGTGLGISIVVSLLEMMGTKLNIESVYSEGSTFSFDLRQPVRDDKPIGDIEEYHKKKLAGKRAKTINIKAPDANVLIVDDNKINIAVLKNILKMTEVNIDTVTSGMGCLEAVRKKRYDIIFLDHLMPEMDGIETVGKLREMDDNLSSSAAVIVLTANAISGAESMYKSAGFDDYLSKPIDFMQLEDIMLKYLPEELNLMKAGQTDSQE
jgi:signal transduction histidine kinase/CheY-like chemotaxis protein